MRPGDVSSKASPEVLGAVDLLSLKQAVWGKATPLARQQDEPWPAGGYRCVHYAFVLFDCDRKLIAPELVLQRRKIITLAVSLLKIAFALYAVRAMMEMHVAAQDSVSQD